MSTLRGSSERYAKTTASITTHYTKRRRQKTHCGHPSGDSVVFVSSASTSYSRPFSTRSRVARMNTEEEDPLNGDVNEDKEDPEKGGAQRDDEKLKDGCFVISAIAVVVIAILCFLSGVVLCLLNRAGIFTDEDRTMVYVLAGFKFVMPIVFIVSYFTMFSFGLWLFSFFTRMCAIYALAAIFCWSRHHFNIQYFLKNYHWFDPKVPAEDQEFKAHIILVVYAVSLIPYIIAAAVACSVAEQCRKYVHELNKPSEEVNE